MQPNLISHAHVAVVGGGPAGLMAAEVLSQAGVQVDLYDAMPSVGRKFLLAGKGGMNITHSEALSDFVARYGAAAPTVDAWLAGFSPDALRAWIHGLGIETFIGSSGRVFPRDMKAAPLLRAWLHRLREAGVRFHMRHRWQGWDQDGAVCFDADGVVRQVRPDALVLALGGASWPRLGSDGAWLPILRAKGVPVTPLLPSNCGFDAMWSAHFSTRYGGQALTCVAVEWQDGAGVRHSRRGQFVITVGGVEGSLIYAISAPLRDRIAAAGEATIWLDLTPDFSLARVQSAVSHPRGARSISSHLQSRLGIKGVKSGLLRECLSAQQLADPDALAEGIKRLPVRLVRARPVEEAISSAGGVTREAVHAGDGAALMLRSAPGVFVAGEMLDWEAPTGGYLLTACFASGRVAAHGALSWLALNCSK